MSELKEIKLKVNKEELAKWQELAREEAQSLEELIKEIMNDHYNIVQEAEREDQLYSLEMNK